MEDELIKVTTRIMGVDYTIRGRASEEHIRRIAAYVDGKMVQISEAYPKLGTSRLAVLAAINMADELFKIREQYEHLTNLLEEEWSQRHSPSENVSGRAGPGRAGRSPAAESAASLDRAEPTGEPPDTGDRRRKPGSGQIPAFAETPAPEETRPSSSQRLLTGDALPFGRKRSGRPDWEPPNEGP